MFNINKHYLTSLTPLFKKRKEISPLDPFPSVVPTPPSPSPSTHHTKKHACLDPGSIQDENLSPVESAGQSHQQPIPAVETSDENLSVEIAEIISDTTSRIFELIRAREAILFREGYNRSLETVLSTCMSYVDDKANYQKDTGESLRNYMSMFMGRKVANPPVANKWTAPQFDSVPEYIYHLFKGQTSTISFGRFNQTPLRAVLSGHVKCWGDGEHDLDGQGTLNLVLSPYVTQEIQIQVLGTVASTGTGILLDKDQNVWLYNVPNSVDGHLDGMLITAAQIMVAGDVMTNESDIIFLKSYPKAYVELEEVEDDEED